jgi:RNA recognition motif-containing protein
VGGISPAVTKEDLEADFRKFGKIEDYKFIRDRNTACVEFFNLDDAIQAMKSMNGKRIGGENIRVDFLRSNSTKKVSLYFRMLFCFLFFNLLFFNLCSSTYCSSTYVLQLIVLQLIVYCSSTYCLLFFNLFVSLQTS